MRCWALDATVARPVHVRMHYEKQHDERSVFCCWHFLISWRHAVAADIAFMHFLQGLPINS